MREKKILIVDFDEESLVALSDLVNEEGFKAITVRDGLAGYEKFKSDDFDLVILEPMLPKLHGFELCKKIIQDPLKKTPIIVVTGIYREPACRAEATQVYGASAFFTKPWNREELRAKILELLATTWETPREDAKPQPEERAHIAPPPQEFSAARMSSRESKLSSDLDEIEKELREAVAGLVSPARLKEAKEIKEKKAPKKDLDREVEAILKGAIGELGLEETKKKVTPRPTPAFQPAPPLRPTSSPKPDPWKEARIQADEEIRKSVSARETSTNNIPGSSSRVLDTEDEPFRIDRTLLEIDKIPLDVGKPILVTEKEPALEKKVEEEKKKFIFDEYAEPKKKKTVLFAASGVAAILVLATSLTFVVFKSKKSAPPSKEMVPSLTAALPPEFSVRQQEIGTAETKGIPEPATTRKPETKKVIGNQAEGQPEQADEIIRPILPAEPPPVQLHVDEESPPEKPLANKEAPLAPAPKTEEVSQPAALSKTEAEQPASAPTEPGALVPLATVSVPPVLIKRVDPRYPAAALALRLEGSVTVNALISETGEVIRTEILKGVKGGYGFEKAAENAVKLWLFRPAQKNGVNVKVWKPIEISFKLSQIPSKE